MVTGLGHVVSNTCVTVDELFMYVVTNFRPPITELPYLVEDSTDTKMTLKMDVSNERLTMLEVTDIDLASFLEFDG